jgi:hypothetical protein
MKNSKYFPFERNKYFYGKLLSVDDFDLEQRYVNNKRRMSNRFLYGVGVVAGLHVVRVDEKTISVEAGFALDSLGREIVVDTPVIKKLSLLEGFESCVEENGKDYVYLCLDYEEEETGIVHNAAGNSMLQGGEETFNKIQETYRLYLTEQESEQARLDKTALYEQETVLYAGDGIKIRLITPKYADVGEQTEIRLEIENMTKKYLAFSYDVWLECFTYQGQSSLNVNFNEIQFEKTGKYTISYMVEATETSQVEGSVAINKSSVKIFMDKEELPLDAEYDTMSIQIVQEDIRNKIVDDYYRSAMENIVAINRQDKLYLAKLYLLRAGDSYVIDRVENVPFNQYILNQNLSFALHQLTTDYFSGNVRKGKKEDGKAGLGKSRETENGIRLAQGKYWLDMNGGGQKGQRYVSEEITHGLGLGAVTVQVGMEDEGTITYGSSEIFKDTDPMMELAVRVFPERGTFQIGGRLLEQVIKSGVNIHWTALMKEEEKVVEKVVRKIFIKPSVLEIGTRESHYLEAICTNMADKTIEWQVKGNGGSISENGMYTAPNTPGVYEVVAQSTAYPEVKSSIFVVVSESV